MCGGNGFNSGTGTAQPVECAAAGYWFVDRVTLPNDNAWRALTALNGQGSTTFPKRTAKQITIINPESNTDSIEVAGPDHAGTSHSGITVPAGSSFPLPVGLTEIVYLRALSSASGAVTIQVALTDTDR